MNLNILWYILIATLYTGYFVLEGFDFGVGMLLPFLSKDDTKRRIIINTIGPHWDGNEVWLITAGGATFAAFPLWYATLFSGFYLPLFLLLVGLIIRGVAFEFRSKNELPTWRTFWDWVIFTGSLIPSFLWGVAFANFIRGVPIDANFNYAGGFFNLLNPFALVGGVLTVLAFIFHGSLFLILKTGDDLLERVKKVAQQIWLPAFGLLILVILILNFSTRFFDSNHNTSFYVALVAVICLGLSGIMNRINKDKLAFLFSALSILFTMGAIFTGLFPNVLPADNGINNLTIYNAASGPTTLRTMTYISLVLVPIVIAYQAWTYWIFRKRIIVNPSEKSHKLEY